MDEILKDYFLEFSKNHAKNALDYFIKGKKYSYEIQYANETIYRWIIKYCYETLDIIKKEHYEKTFLDFGCGIGAFEYFNDKFFDCNIDSCDWEDRDEIYEFMSLKKPKYYCSDWLNDNFEIYDCKIKYDVILIMRSTVLHKHSENTDLPNSLENFIKLLKKLLPYVKSSGNIILIQPQQNFITEIKEFLDDNNSPFFCSNVPGEGKAKIYNLKPNSIKTFTCQT